MTSLQAALAFASRGWPVVAVHHKTTTGLCSCQNWYCRGIAKHPRIDEHPQRFATKDSGVISKWWGDNPNDNVAIAAGSRSGLIVLDIDPRHGGDVSLKLLLGRNGALPRTVRVFTGGGGEHYYFKAPRFEVRGRIGMVPGIDVRAEDQLFIAPPSRHQNGTLYKWDESANLENAPIADLPAWLLQRILTKNPPQGKTTAAKRKTRSGIELPDEEPMSATVSHVVDRLGGNGWEE